jgi:hypothetical protein
LNVPSLNRNMHVVNISPQDTSHPQLAPHAGSRARLACGLARSVTIRMR